MNDDGSWKSGAGGSIFGKGGVYLRGTGTVDMGHVSGV